MATRRLALIGAASGPWIRTASVRAPFLKIDGLAQGCAVDVEIRRTGLDAAIFSAFVVNGVHELNTGDWMQVTCKPVCKSVICEVISKEAA